MSGYIYLKSARLLYLLALIFFLNESFAQQVGSNIHIQQGHTDCVTTVVFLPDGKTALSGSWDRTLRLWDMTTGKEIRAFTGHDGWIYSIAVSPDGKTAASCYRTGFCKIWDIASGKEIQTIRGVYPVTFSPDGELLVVTEQNGTIRVWDFETKKEIKVLSGHTESVNSIAFSPDGKTLISGSGDLREKDSTIKLWDIEKGTEIRTLTGHGKRVISVAFSPDGSTIVSGSQDSTIRLWDVASGTEIKQFKLNAPRTNVLFSKDGKTIYSGTIEMEIIGWDIATGKETKIPTGYNRPINYLALSPDGKTILIASNDNSLKLLELNSGKEIHHFRGHYNPIRQIALSPDGKMLVTCALNDTTIKLWDIANGNLVKTFKGHSQEIWALAFSPDGQKFASGSADQTVKIWDISSGKELLTYTGHKIPYFLDYVYSVAFSPDGKSLASGTYTIRLIDTKTGNETQTFDGHGKPCRSITFASNGKSIYTTAADNTLKKWDIVTGKEIKSIPIKAQPVALLRDEKTAVTSYSDNGVYNAVNYINISDGSLIITFNGQHTMGTGQINSLVISPDGKTVLSGSGDHTIKLWNIADGNLIKTFNGHTGAVNSAVFSPDGKTIISGSEDNTIKVWDTEKGNLIYTALTNKEGSEWMAFNPDGYWDASPNGGDLVAMVQGLDIFAIDQFATKNNRPDKILENIPEASSEMISYYNNQYKKRLRKLGLTEEQLSAESHVPVVKITDAKQNGKTLNIKFRMSDDKYDLKRYNIFINDVPFFGSSGKELKGNNIELSEKIDLSQGNNKVEISCLNEKGAESYRALTNAGYKEDVKKDLYLLAFGVSKYDDPELNLKFADKDALDLEKIMLNMKGIGFENVHTKVLTNEQVTPKSIKAARDFVKNAKPEDTFILFIAGHGVHDNDAEATYYFLTYNTNLSKLSSTAADFETIEDLLQGIPPRNKLFLMDTCESGEIEEGVQNTYYASADSRGLKGRGIRINEKVSSEPVKAEKRTYLYEKDRYIYNDLARRSGAIVFSSSKGGELSYEKDDIQNGLFTEEIIKCLTSKEADKDNNGTISTDELREFVANGVARSSGDLQHPTVDRDNIYQKFGFGIVE